ncbi:OprD family outer membrane porin [Hydrogenimonas urashimensis]|uniref:OprD family outer membrane porin n=1 Tax=Hydrogenimonas urashimensis TaxID=2740515 RepID=UPI001915777A|nr:OprD family outer membrane porin [Hydrogenimonas urashimensis]
MRRIHFAVSTAALLMVVSAQAAEPIAIPSAEVVDDDHSYEPLLNRKPEGIFLYDTGWKISGDMRAGWVDYDYSNPYPANPNVNKGHTDSRGLYLIPKVSLESPDFNGWSGKVTVAGATDFGLNDPDDESRTFVLGTDNKSYAILQEAYVQYKNGDHEAAIGAKEIVTPMIDADDWYMLADTFQAAYYVNKQIDHLKLGVAYFYKMAGPWDSGARNGSEEYASMSEASFLPGIIKDDIGDEGVYTVAGVYNIEHHNLQLWDYYGNDMYNTFFAQYDFTDRWESLDYDFGLQFIDFTDVGKMSDWVGKRLDPADPDSRFEGIDYNIFSLRFDGSFDNGFDFATGASFYSDGPGTGDTLGAWGGYPYFANGMIFHFFEAGSLRNANSYKLQLGYDMGKLGAGGLWGGVRYTYFDLDGKYSKTASDEPQSKMQLLGLRLSYKNEGGVYFTGTYEHVDLDHEPNTWALRLIGGVTF